MLHPWKLLTVDEQLIAFRGRSKHFIQIRNRAAGKGYKVFTIGEGAYTVDFLFYSGDENLETRLDFRNRISEQVVLQLVDRLPIAEWSPPPLSWRLFCIVMDNWFTTASLCSKLRSRGHAALGTAKSGAGIATE